ncbi:MAG: hypothetical protein U0Y82_03650 [Thermoleophilia bacterium]
MDFGMPIRLVSNGLEGPVLAALVRAERPLTGREVARALGQSSHSGVRAALHRLAAQGIVTALPAGRATIYQLNRDHLAAPHVVALVELTRELTRRLRRQMEQWDIPPVWAVLLGDAPREGGGDEGRVELLLVRPDDVWEHEPGWRDQVAQLRTAAQRWTGNAVVVTEHSVAELERGAAAAMVREAMVDGVDLVGSPGAI